MLKGAFVELRSCLVYEEDADSISMAAACGSRFEALRCCWYVRWSKWLPHRLYHLGIGLGPDDVPENYSAWHFRGSEYRRRQWEGLAIQDRRDP